MLQRMSHRLHTDYGPHEVIVYLQRPSSSSKSACELLHKIFAGGIRTGICGSQDPSPAAPALAKRGMPETPEPQLSPKTQCGKDSPASLATACSAEDVSSQQLGQETSACKPTAGGCDLDIHRPAEHSAGADMGILAQPHRAQRLSQDEDSAQQRLPAPTDSTHLRLMEGAQQYERADLTSPSIRSLAGGSKQQQHRLADYDDDAIGGRAQGCGNGPDVGRTSAAGREGVRKKGTRPSSWQRRKLAKQRAAQAAHEAGTLHPDSLSY